MSDNLAFNAIICYKLLISNLTTYSFKQKITKTFFLHLHEPFYGTVGSMQMRLQNKTSNMVEHNFTKFFKRFQYLK